MVRAPIKLSLLASLLCLGACSQQQQPPAAGPKGPETQQQTQNVPQGKTWDEVAKLPDLIGPWKLDDAPDPAHNNDAIPFTPEITPKYAEIRMTIAAGGPLPLVRGKCIAYGMPTMMYEPTGAYLQILPVPGQIDITTSVNGVRRIYTDGRPHMTDPDLSYAGDAVGRWEAGGVLVVDVNAMLTDVELVPGLMVGGKTHVTERYHLKDANTLQIDTELEDVNLTAPYKYTHTYTRHRDEEMPQDFCILDY